MRTHALCLSACRLSACFALSPTVADADSPDTDEAASESYDLTLHFIGRDGRPSDASNVFALVQRRKSAFTDTSTRLLVTPPDAGGGRALQHWVRGLAKQRGFNPEAERYVQVAGVLDRIYAAHSLPLRGSA
jgi:hypothetical protein